MSAEAALQACLDNAVAAGIPGIAARVATSGGRIWRGHAGHADLATGRPIDEYTLFGIGSITKSFTAMVALELVAEGKLSFATQAGEVLDPELIQGIANASTATLDGLLTHHAGVPSWEDEPAWQRAARGAGIDPGRAWGAADGLDFVRGAASVAAPGSYAYSNSHTTLLGLMIEAVTGRNCAEEIRHRVISPLKLKSAHLEGFEPKCPGYAPRRYHYDTAVFLASAGHGVGFRPAMPGLIDASASTLAPEWVAGGIVCTADDLLRLAIALGGGIQDLGPWRPAGPGKEVGRGLFRFVTPLGARIGHHGNVLGFTASMWWTEDRQSVAVIVANVGTVHAGDTPPCARSIALSSGFLQAARTVLEQDRMPECTAVSGIDRFAAKWR